jgi:hypothetical protein
MKSSARIVIAIAFFVLFGCVLVHANEKRASLPSRVLSASTVFVDNQTTSAELTNTAYTELSKWGRLQVVDTAQKADIVLRLSNGNFVKFVPGGENATAADAKASKQNFVGADEAVPPGSTRIAVIDPKTGTALWSDIRKTDNPKAATHMLDGLRDAFDQKQK